MMSHEETSFAYFFSFVIFVDVHMWVCLCVHTRGFPWLIPGLSIIVLPSYESGSSNQTQNLLIISSFLSQFALGNSLSLPSQPRTTLGSPHPPGTCVGTQGFELQSTHVHDKHFNHGAMPRRLLLILKSLKEAWSVFEPIIPHTLGVHYLNEGNILKQCFIYLLSIRAPGEPFRIYCINLFHLWYCQVAPGDPLSFIASICVHIRSKCYTWGRRFH